MDLDEVVHRYAIGLQHVDLTTTTVNVNKKTGPYLPGLHTLREDQAVRALSEWWAATFPLEVTPPNFQSVERKYPRPHPGKCDHVF